MAQMKSAVEKAMQAPVIESQTWTQRKSVALSKPCRLSPDSFVR